MGRRGAQGTVSCFAIFENGDDSSFMIPIYRIWSKKWESKKRSDSRLTGLEQEMGIKEALRFPINRFGVRNGSQRSAQIPDLRIGSKKWESKERSDSRLTGSEQEMGIKGTLRFPFNVFGARNGNQRSAQIPDLRIWSKNWESKKRSDSRLSNLE